MSGCSQPAPINANIAPLRNARPPLDTGPLLDTRPPLDARPPLDVRPPLDSTPLDHYHPLVTHSRVNKLYTHCSHDEGIGSDAKETSVTVPGSIMRRLRMYRVARHCTLLTQVLPKIYCHVVADESRTRRGKEFCCLQVRPSVGDLAERTGEKNMTLVPNQRPTEHTSDSKASTWRVAT